MKSKHLSEEHKKNISRAQTGRKNHFYGKHHTEEAKRKIIEANKNTKAVKCVETGKVYKSIGEAQRETGISRNKIGDVCNGRRNTTSGYHWQFISE